MAWEDGFSGVGPGALRQQRMGRAAFPFLVGGELEGAASGLHQSRPVTSSPASLTSLTVSTPRQYPGIL